MNNFPSRLFLLTKSNHAGFTFIELLISLLVLLLGIHGTMKMQLHAIQMSHQSNFYSTAVELASEMADKIRSNQMQFENDTSFLNAHFQPKDKIPELTSECYANNCSLEQLAQADITEWIQRLNASLPNAHVMICRDSAPWNNSIDNLNWTCASSDDKASVIIKLGWAEPNDESAYPSPRLAFAVNSCC